MKDQDRKAYHQLSAKDYKEHSLLINCTPLGTHPNTDAYPPIDYKQINAEHLLYDLIYNPKVTTFMQMGKDKGAEPEWLSNARRASRGLMVFMDGLAQKSKLTKFYYLVIVKVNQDMLDNDANLQDANEDKVDEKIPETEDHPKQEDDPS